jgi:glycosyltransferase involved in cell wall biosynthesis
MTRRWSINGRFLIQPLTGVQRYASEIVSALDDLVASRHPLSRDLELEILVPEKATRALATSMIGVREVRGHGHLWEQLALPRHAAPGLLSFCNTGPVAHGKQIVCIHDMNTRLAPASYSAEFRALYRVLLPALGRSARAVTTVSAYSAAEIARFHTAPPGKITVIPNGHEHVLRWKPRHSDLTRSIAGRNTVVLVGSIAPHKNVGLVLGLADKLAEAGLRIAVVGMSDPRIFAGSTAKTDASNIYWLGRLSDDELAALLQDSLCLCFPSLTEGFGLPPLEAMALGCPVITTDAASLPEVCGDAALFASPVDADAWLSQILSIYGDVSLARRLSAAGMARAKVFSWRRSAERYLDLMARIDRILPAQSAQPDRATADQTAA